MREIKYRGLGVDGKWWYGERHPAGERHVNLATFFANLHVGAINQETAGEYTGLLDKQGKEIYEGDILMHEDFKTRKHKSIGVMEWDDKIAGFNIFYPLWKFEVIGNIWEHSHLLDNK